MKKLWEQFVAWLLTQWLKLKPWLIKNWMIMANYFIIFMAYSIIYGKDGVVGAEVLLGLWLFASAGIGMYKLFIKK